MLKKVFYIHLKTNKFIYRLSTNKLIFLVFVSLLLYLNLSLIQLNNIL